MCWKIKLKACLIFLAPRPQRELEIDVKLDFGYLPDRQVGGLVAFENAGGADASQTV
jgi:hypothetical protein